MEARSHEHAPLVEVQRWSNLAPGVALFDHILVVENLTLPEELARPFPGMEIREEAASSLTNYPLNVVVLPGRELVLSLRWDGARYGEPEAVRLLERLARLLTVFAEDGDPRLGELPLLLEGSGNSSSPSGTTRRKPGDDLLLHQLFEAAAERPESGGGLGGRGLTYDDLEERATGSPVCCAT